jgi:acetylornithine/succinyldiaminopimelate/putrescine aminotransferase
VSLADLVGREYVDAVCAARAALLGADPAALRAEALEPVDFLPASFQARQEALLEKVGAVVSPAASRTARGATTAAFEENSHSERAPLSAVGAYRVGEDGKLYLTAKSEHYHVSVGHAFPGYALVERARRLGVPNATHNNTRGHITRLLEEELVWTAGGAVSRVLNLETGSLAAEAAIKMLLSRFFAAGAGAAEPVYRGRTPVFVVIGDDEEGLEANYHGTTVIAQIMRGMWAELREGLETGEMLAVRCVRPNDLEGLEAVFDRYDTGQQKIAGFFHELILMNYGARRLTERFVGRAYELCAARDVPTVVDEIQSCVWSPEVYLFREYRVAPAFVVIGKGFSGGEYAASRILFSDAMDTLPQFGALVTNGQEELASLAYLVTLRWAEANAEATRALGERFETRLRETAARFPGVVHGIDGRRHLAGICFHDLAPGKAFAARLNRAGVDISVQTYKEDCPPVALTKLPITAGPAIVDGLIDRIDEGLRHIAGAG